MIEEGVENQIAITGTIAAVTTAAAFAKTHGPMIKGIAGVVKNVIWGEQVTVKTVDVKAIDRSFDDSKKFVAEIKSRFPNSHARIVSLRNDLKQHHFDLSGVIQDVSLMADSTEHGASKVERNLGLRARLMQKGKINNSKEGLMMDVKLWDKTI